MRRQQFSPMEAGLLHCEPYHRCQIGLLQKKFICRHDPGDDLARRCSHTGESRYPSPPSHGCQPAPAWRNNERTCGDLPDNFILCRRA